MATMARCKKFFGPSGTDDNVSNSTRLCVLSGDQTPCLPEYLSLITKLGPKFIPFPNPLVFSGHIAKYLQHESVEHCPVLVWDKFFELSDSGPNLLCFCTNGCFLPLAHTLLNVSKTKLGPIWAPLSFTFAKHKTLAILPSMILWQKGVFAHDLPFRSHLWFT